MFKLISSVAISTAILAALLASCGGTTPPPGEPSAPTAAPMEHTMPDGSTMPGHEHEEGTPPHEHPGEAPKAR